MLSVCSCTCRTILLGLGSRILALQSMPSHRAGLPAFLLGSCLFAYMRQAEASTSLPGSQETLCVCWLTCPMGWWHVGFMALEHSGVLQPEQCASPGLQAASLPWALR